MSKSWDIVGYTFNADLYCTDHIVAQLTTNAGDVHHNEAAIGNAEAHLDLLARLAHIDRQDERSFDSSDFPKVIFNSDVTWRDQCCICGVYLDGDDHHIIDDDDNA